MEIVENGNFGKWKLWKMEIVENGAFHIKYVNSPVYIKFEI
jgi:hypothetical protein